MTGGELHEVVRAAIEPSGFRRRRGSTWRRDAGETEQIVHLDHSPVARAQHYLDLGVWIKAADPEQTMEHYGHVRMRADDLAETDPPLDLLTELSDHFVRSPIDDATRASLVTQFVTEHVLPFLESARTIEGIKRLYHERRLTQALVHRDALDLIDPEWVVRGHSL